MAEINYNNLYNQLSPLDKLFYDQQFSKNYAPGQENIMLEMKPGYEQMKSVYDAQQQVPEKSFFDSLNPFTSASAAEMPPVPNLSLGYNMPTFDLGTGITNTTAASPFKIGLSDTLTQYNVPGLRSQNLQEDLIQQIIAENQAKRNLFARPNMLDIAGGITNIDLIEENQLPYSSVGDMRYMTPRTIADQNRILGQTFTEQKPSGIEKLLQYLPFGEKSLIYNLLSTVLPKESPEIKGMKSFYRNEYGLDPVGRVASGIMKGYNPVSGGLLNMITGGKYGKPTQFGLAGAMQKRIEDILGRRAAQTDASRAQVEELRNLQLKEMQDRSDRGESLSSIGKSTFSGKGKAFEKRQGTTTGKGTANERNYGGR
jgi:hypothetical protein